MRARYGHDEPDAVQRNRIIGTDGIEIRERRAAAHVILAVHFQPADLGLGLRDHAMMREAQPDPGFCRTSTRHGLDSLPPDTDGHFIKLPPDLACAALGELSARLEALGESRAHA